MTSPELSAWKTSDSSLPTRLFFFPFLTFLLSAKWFTLLVESSDSLMEFSNNALLRNPFFFLSFSEMSFNFTLHSSITASDFSLATTSSFSIFSAIFEGRFWLWELSTSSASSEELPVFLNGNFLEHFFKFPFLASFGNLDACCSGGLFKAPITETSLPSVLPDSKGFGSLSSVFPSFPLKTDLLLLKTMGLI